MKFRSLMTAICVMATANLVYAAPFAYVANSGTKNVSVIDTADNLIKATIALPDTQPTVHPSAWGVAVGSSGQYVYVGLQETNEVAVLDAATHAVIKRIALGADSPGGLAVNDAETRLYIASEKSNTLIVIDISGIGAAEVGRVTVDPATISNPKGVVLNAAGDKAYVANASTGNIAVVDLDETNNVYTKTSTIALGGTQPFGLALSPDGAMLYASSLTGDPKGIKLSDNAITSLSLNSGDGDGNLALAVKPDGSRVYAPANSIDKLFVIDSSVTPNVVLGTNYSVIAGPYGISVTPDGSKLYMTMNTASAGETVKVFSTATNTEITTINLPSLAKPISFGDFIGPVLPYTITSAAQANCTVSPLGVVPVNQKGRVYNVSASAGGACQIFTGCNTGDFTGGTDQGILPTYAFTNVAANDTICAKYVTGTYYTLDVDWNPVNIASRYLVSTPTGINGNSKSALFPSGQVVTIKANTGYAASNWTGACAGTSGTTCTITMDADKIAGADINPAVGGGPFYNVTKSSYSQTFAEIAAAAAANDYIKISSLNTSVTTDGTPGLMVKAGNHWLEPDHAVKDSYKPMILIITNVGVTVEPSDTIVL